MNERIDEIRKKVITLINDVLNRRLNPKEALDEWPEDIDDDPTVGKAWHELCHFYSDADIRSKDLKYAAYKEEKLRKIIKELESESKDSNPGEYPVKG